MFFRVADREGLKFVGVLLSRAVLLEASGGDERGARLEAVIFTNASIERDKWINTDRGLVLEGWWSEARQPYGASRI